MAYDPFRAVQTGIDFTQGIFDRGANLASGRAAAQGNYGAAANAQFANGNIAGGATLQDRGTALDTAARTRRTADGTAALGVYKQVTDALEGEVANGPQAVIAAFTRIRPVLERTGATAEQLDAYGQMLQQDPVAAIRTVRGAIGQAEWEFRDGGAGDVVAVRQGPGGRVESQVAYDAPDRPIVSQFGIILPPNARPAGSTVGPAPAASGAAPAMTGPAISGGPLWSGGEFEDVIPALRQREGGFVANDGSSGAPANFGINQRANPDVNVRNLTGDQANEIYRERYWNPVVQAGVPPQAREAVFDFAVNAGPQTAIRLWNEADGDIGRFNERRLEYYRSLPDYAQYGQSWERRVAETSGDQQVAQGSDAGQELQDLGGGYTLQPMTTAAEQRQAQAEARRAELDARRDQREEGRYQRETSGALTPAQQASQSAQTFTQERQLRTEFGSNPAVKTLATVRPQVQIIGDIARRANAGQPISAADDLALIFSYMKMLDPGSVVREGEFANAQNTAGVPERVVNAYNRALDGTRLSDNQRNEFFRSATGVMRGYQQSYDEVVTRQRGLAESYGLNADRIAPATPPAAQPGTRAERGAAERLRFTLTPQQQSIAESSGYMAARQRGDRVGSRSRPIFINGRDSDSISTSFANVPRGAYFRTPDGELRGPKP